MKEYKIETKCIQEGYKPQNGEPRILPIYQSTTYKYDSSEHLGDLFDLKAGYNKVRVYIWIEGQDLDCDNSISGNTVSVNLQFTQDEEVNG